MTGIVSKVCRWEVRGRTACDDDQETEGKDGSDTNLLFRLHLELENHGDG